MIAREIKPQIKALVAIDWDRRLFDELVPLPEGTTYNSYLVRGAEKTALIDSAYTPFIGDLLGALKREGVDRLDYIVANHAEQDHSAAIPALLEAYPEARIVTNSRCKGLIAEAMGIGEDKFFEVNDGDVVSLGGKNLRFLLTPWVHWPDTMVTYIPEEKILFTCDFFGSHVASSDLFAVNEPRIEDAARRYYAEIMMPFRNHIQKHLARLGELEIEMIAPSHGPVHNRPAFILDLYRRWAGGPAKPEVVIASVSMYESTTRMMNYLIDRLLEQGISVQQFNMVEADSGVFAGALVEASTVILASPVVLAGPHPGIVTAAYLMNALKPKTRYVGIIGSFGWGGNVLTKSVQELLGGLKAQIEYLDPVLTKGQPEEQDFKNLDRLAAAIVERCARAEEAVTA